MKKNLLLLFLGIWILLYFIPCPQPTFLDNYKMKDEIYKSFLSFKNEVKKSIIFNDKEWFYNVSGAGEETIFFVHGMGGSYFLWWQQVEALKKDYKIISYELPAGVKSLEEASNGILAIIDAEKVAKVNIIGTSMGGYISQYVVHKAPERINKAVFGNTFPPNDLIKSENRLKNILANFLPQIIIYKLRNQNFKKGMAASSSKPELIESYLLSVPFQKKQFKERYQIVTDEFKINFDQQAIQDIPKLIFECDNDPLIRKELREGIKERYPSATIYNFGNEGHIPCVSAPKKYNKVLLEFLRN